MELARPGEEAGGEESEGGRREGVELSASHGDGIGRRPLPPRLDAEATEDAQGGRPVERVGPLVEAEAAPLSRGGAAAEVARPLEAIDRRSGRSFP